jgi:hypothetical protein
MDNYIKCNCCLLLVIDVSDWPWIFWREPIKCHCIRLALVFFGKNQSQDRCIRPALDSPVRTDQVIIASDRPWCFSARTDQIVVQISDEFSTSV